MYFLCKKYQKHWGKKNSLASLIKFLVLIWLKQFLPPNPTKFTDYIDFPKPPPEDTQNKHNRRSNEKWKQEALEIQKKMEKI